VDTLFNRQFLRHRDQVSQQGFINRRDGIHRFDVPVGNDENMYRGNWVGILEGGDQVVLIITGCRRLAGRNLTKNTGHEVSPVPTRRSRWICLQVLINGYVWNLFLQVMFVVCIFR